jgi:hypothetical protein
MPEQAVISTGIWASILAFFSAAYLGITGHIYGKLGDVNSKIEKEREHNEDKYVTKETLEAQLDAIQQANLATAKFTDANTRITEGQGEAIRELVTLINTKQDKI